MSLYTSIVPMIILHDLSVSVQDTPIIDHLSLRFERGQNYCLLGKNGSGKSSLALTLMWHPAYTITSGEITLDGNDLTAMSPDERAKAGIFLAFQSIPEIKWIKLFEFLRTIYSAKHGKQESFVSFKKIIEPLINELGIDKEFLRRDLNVGFSGGERRKIEILQIRLLQPTYIILDEVDSGLDVDAFKAVASLMRDINSSDVTFIVITHYFSILDYIPIDHVYVLERGKLVAEGDSTLAAVIQKDGFGGS